MYSQAPNFIHRKNPPSPVIGEPPTVQVAGSMPEMGVIVMKGTIRLVAREDGRCFLVSELGTAGVRPATGAIKPLELKS